MEKFKKLLKENWKAALVGALATAAVSFGVPADWSFGAGEAVSGEDARQEICSEYCEEHRESCSPE
jgi:hypothetical protein